MSTINPDVLLGSYAALAFFSPIYPLLCVANEIIDNGNGYFYLIPQLFLPSNQRPHASTVGWPGIILNSDLLNTEDTEEPDIEYHYSHDTYDDTECDPEPEPEPESDPEPEPEPQSDSSAEVYIDSSGEVYIDSSGEVYIDSSGEDYTDSS